MDGDVHYEVLVGPGASGDAIYNTLAASRQIIFVNQGLKRHLVLHFSDDF